MCLIHFANHTTLPTFWRVFFARHLVSPMQLQHCRLLQLICRTATKKKKKQQYYNLSEFIIWTGKYHDLIHNDNKRWNKKIMTTFQPVVASSINSYEHFLWRYILKRYESITSIIWVFKDHKYCSFSAL